LKHEQKTLVLFDIDGTLLYSNGKDSSSFTQSYEDCYNVHFPEIDFSNYPHVSDHTIFRTIIQQDFGRVPTQEEIDAFQDHYVNMIIEKRKIAPHHYMEVPGAKKAMDDLLEDPNYVVGIATGGWRRPATIKLAHLGFDTTSLFDSYADNRETREEILQDAINQATAVHGEQIQRMVYIGDAHWDVRTTKNMGLNFIGIRLKGDLGTLTKLGADYVLHNFSNQSDFQSFIHSSVPPR
jgi:phosphoglycolate phosphatase-like HAD superfamily hydrolase